MSNTLKRLGSMGLYGHKIATLKIHISLFVSGLEESSIKLPKKLRKFST